VTSEMHLENLLQRSPVLGSCRETIRNAFTLLRHSFRAQGKLLLCGNGGSAADADHWAGELLKGFCSKRPLDSVARAKLPEALGTRLQGALPVIPLTGFPAFTTAFGNDVSPELAFAQLVWALGNAHDIFIGISTSGNARNVCAAAQAARARGLATIALTGEKGGLLKPLCDVSICVPAHETYLIQELHLPIYHCLSLMLEDEFFAP
jgi:D-sedoheptulose 7-phosphate isomerase